MSPLFIGLKYVSLKDVSLKDVGLKDVSLNYVSLKDVSLKYVSLKDVVVPQSSLLTCAVYAVRSRVLLDMMYFLPPRNASAYCVKRTNINAA